MKKLQFFLMSLLLVLAFNVQPTHAVPDIRGIYTGTYTTVVSNCVDSGTYHAVLSMTISTQTGNTFSGSATGTFDLDGLTAIEYIQLSGTITESGQISGNTTHTFLGTGGEGTFTGQLSGNTLSIENPGHDTYGNTCTYIRTMSATRTGIPLSSFSANPTSGIAPLSVNFTDRSTGTITSWNWNFGDGTSSDIQNPSHTYTHEGKYNVSLTVSGPHGTDTETKTDYISVFGISNITEFKISPSDGVFFGYSVSISGDYAIVGAPRSRSAYIFERSGSNWNQVAKLTASDVDVGNNFGISVSIFGDYAIVGANHDDDRGFLSGAAYIFEKNGSSWNQVDKLTASDGGNSDNFGLSVSISGNNAIVGAWRHFNAYRGDYSGAAYIFEKNGSSWNQVAKLTPDKLDVNRFGISVSISGGYAIVGALISDLGTRLNSGAAYIFEKSGSSWNQVDKLTASDEEINDENYFGFSVSISGNYAIVGAYMANDNGYDSGSAYIFEKSGSSWNQVDKLIASDNAAWDNFGQSVSIAGNYAIVGAHQDDDRGSASGSAYIFKKSSSSWNQVDKLTASNGAAVDYFGFSVSISGNYAIVGAYSTVDNGLGSAYIFGLPILSNIAMPWIPLLMLDD